MIHFSNTGILDIFGSFEKDLLTKKNELLGKYKSNPLDHYFSLKPPNVKEDAEGRFFVSDEKKEGTSDPALDSDLNDLFEQALKKLDDPDAVTIPETKIPEIATTESKEPVTEIKDDKADETS